MADLSDELQFVDVTNQDSDESSGTLTIIRGSNSTARQTKGRRTSWQLQGPLQVDHTFQRIVVVCRDFLKPKLSIEQNGSVHFSRQAVQPHSFIADLACLLDQLINHPAAVSLTASSGSQ